MARRVLDPQEELRKTREACQKIEVLLANEKLWFNLRVAGMELSDATEDMNEALKDIQETFLRDKLRPGWIPLNDKVALVWDGRQLLWDDGERPPDRVASASRAKRLLGLQNVEQLWLELTRPRLTSSHLSKTTKPPPSGHKRQ